MKKSKVKQNTFKWIYGLLALLFSCVILSNIFTLVKRFRSHGDTISEINEINNIISEISQNKESENSNGKSFPNTDYYNYIKIPISDFNLEKFKKLNGDTVGFLSVFGTRINYPIVKTENNNFYLNHSFKKRENSAGWVFMDYRNNSENLDRNTVIYAHSNLDKTMFGTLSNILKPEWMSNEENGVLKFANSSGVSNWKIFSVYTIPAESRYIQTHFKNAEEYRVWAEEMASRSKYNLGYKFEKDEKIITLSTCYSDSQNIRLVVHAKQF